MALLHTDTASDDTEVSAITRDDEVLHIVGRRQSFLNYALGLTVPRALCGESLAEDPDNPSSITADSPLCPRCVRRGGVRGNWIRRHRVIEL